MSERKLSGNGWLPGALLVGFGLLFLLQTLGIVGWMGQTMAGLVFLGGAALSLSVVLQDQRRWWALFPAFFLGFIGLAILGDAFWLFRRVDLGPIFLGGLGAAFLAVYAMRREHVWAIIPGGVLLTLALMAMIDGLWLPYFNKGSLFFFGLSATFGAVYWYGERARYSWALVVAAVLAAIGFMLFVGSMMKLLFPLALVGLGIFLLMRQRNQ